jgi:phospholipid N-methyltransferase
MKRRIHFFRESLKNMKTTGSVTHSSKFLCRGMIKPVNFHDATLIVELGAGDGVITKHILKKMRPDAKLLVFEVNKKFCKKVREKIDDERMILIEDSAEHLPEHLERLGLPKVEFIVSAIPFVALPKEVTWKILKVCKENLIQGGLYIQMHYSLVLKKTYERIFGNVSIDFIPVNVPPAFVMVSRKE